MEDGWRKIILSPVEHFSEQKTIKVVSSSAWSGISRDCLVQRNGLWMVVMEPKETKKKRVQKTLTTIFETLVEDHGMEPSEVGSLMVDAGNAVAGEDGSVYLYVVMREIEKRIGRSLF